MVWYPWGKSKENEGDTAPSRENRQQCWETRDAYFTCLDRVFVVKSGDEGNANCVKEKAAYEGSCAKSWIDYFNQRRVIGEAQKERLARVNEAGRK